MKKRVLLIEREHITETIRNYFQENNLLIDVAESLGEIKDLTNSTKYVAAVGDAGSIIFSGGYMISPNGMEIISFLHKQGTPTLLFGNYSGGKTKGELLDKCYKASVNEILKLAESSAE